MPGASNGRPPRVSDISFGILHFSFLLMLLVAFVAVVTSGFLQLLPSETGYSLSAKTELAEVELHDLHGEKILFSEVSLQQQPETVYRRASLRLLSGSVVTMQRLQKGELRIQVDWPDNSAGARLITHEGKEIKLERNDSLIVPMHDGTVTLSFKGALLLGQQTARDMEGVLLDGRVTIAQKPRGYTARYVISESTLDAGDTLLWQQASGTKVDVAGFVHVDADQAMRVVAHAEAHHVTVQRYGGRDYEISPEWWDRFAHDPYLSSSVAILGFLSGIFLVYEAWPKVWKRHWPERPTA